MRDFTSWLSQPAAQREDFLEYWQMSEAAEAALEAAKDSGGGDSKWMTEQGISMGGALIEAI